MLSWGKALTSNYSFLRKEKFLGIPDSKLEIWSKLGATKSAINTHLSIRNAIEKYDWPSNLDYEVYLQGSYKNNTNIRGDSDVDVVTQLNSTFKYNISTLSQLEQDLFRQDYQDSEYSWSIFRTEVLKALQSYFGTHLIEEGKKTIKLKPDTGFLAADIVVCLQYRNYNYYRGLKNQDYADGMKFWVPTEGRWIINYPKIHYDNATEKSGRTNGLYKRFVRIFKNARSYLIDQKIIDKSLAPSYFIECLLYNISDGEFQTPLSAGFLAILRNLIEAINNDTVGNYVCVNEQVYLIGDGPEEWAFNKLDAFVNEIGNLWNNW